ncbi:hypothetical protein KP22_16100 [Pectobacterium betavasculorum]|uniref:Multidrug transporter MatE n=1 Tax=Pectobacterium betavasculorum TaxID=55207 RepID=A0A093RZG2_9GAMM|nr:MATE family efflux transporter [Pectobacterium betavasculorum]KFX03246.1 hypothetical protein KP22_16100 [Pectobacterium betavasculorum]KFX18281.1 hypothetical protein JV35_16700 [Pectobacterium betavasculorum]
MSVTSVSFSRLILPIFFQMALLLAIFLTDTFFLSSVSDMAVAGVGSAIPVLLTAIALMHAFSDPGISILGQQLGQGNRSRLSSTFFVMLVVCSLLAIILTATTLLIAYPFGEWIGLDKDASVASRDYLIYISPIFILDILFINFNSMIFAHGQTRWAMYAAISSAVTNLALNIILYLNVFPGWQLGVKEVAMATLFAQIPPILIMGYAIFYVIGFRFKFSCIHPADFGWARKRILSISIPATIEPISYNISQLVVYSMLAGISVTSVAAYSYGKNIFLLFSWAAALAVGIGTQIVVSHFQGEKQYCKADNRMTRSLCKFLPAVFVAGIFINFFADSILSVFTQDQALIALTQKFLMFMLVIETFKAGNFVLFPTLRGSGDIRMPVVISLISHWIFCIALGYYLAFYCNWGIYGLMTGVAADELLRLAASVWRWYRRYWVTNYEASTENVVPQQS